MAIKFFWNGIKGSDGKLQPAYFWQSELRSYPAGTITIEAKRYRRFSEEVATAFTVQNDTDLQSDYFEHDRIRVTPEHPLYSAVKAACDKGAERAEAQQAARIAKAAR